MMTLERALTLATGADNGELNPLWREVVEILAEEVEKNRADIKFCEDCPFTMDVDDMAVIAEEKEDDRGEGYQIPALTAQLLADYADQLADTLADFAGELNLSGVQYETDSLIITAHSQMLVKLAGRIRADK